MQIIVTNLDYFVFNLEIVTSRGHGGAAVTHSPPSSEVGGSNPNVQNLVSGESDVKPPNK